jgi:hypothetical protein
MLQDDVIGRARFAVDVFTKLLRKKMKDEDQVPKQRHSSLSVAASSLLMMILSHRTCDTKAFLLHDRC